MVDKKRLLKNSILKELYFEEGLSCAALCIKVHKSFPLIAKLIDELVEENLVIESGYAPSKGGRRPLTYALQKDVMYIVSVAMDQFVTKIAIMDMQNNFVTPIAKVVLPLPDNPHAFSVLMQNIKEVIDASGIVKEKIVGIGIGMPGLVNVKKGINYSFGPFASKSITKQIADNLGIPAFIDNDSSLIALAELRFGMARGEKNALVVNVGWGIGLGLILNGELFRGHEGFAGEFSHIPLFLNGKLCTCGKTGCLETETSLLLILDSIREGINSGRLSKLSALPPEDLESACSAFIRAVQDGDQFAMEVLSKAGYNIGRGVAVLLHVLNPKVIILSGRGSCAGQIWQAPIQQALNEYCISRLHYSTSIKISTLGLDAELIGAATLVMENYERRIPVIKGQQDTYEIVLN